MNSQTRLEIETPRCKMVDVGEIKEASRNAEEIERSMDFENVHTDYGKEDSILFTA